MVDDLHIKPNEVSSLGAWQLLSQRQRQYLLMKNLADTAAKWLMWAVFWCVAMGLYWIFSRDLSETNLTPELLSTGLRYWIGFFVCLNIAELPFFWWFESRRMGWRLSATQLSVCSGWRGHIEQVMPLCRVQTYQSVQGWIARQYGLAEVTVVASGNNQLTISYLTQAQAAELTEALQQAVQRDVGPSCATVTDKIIEEL